MDLIKAFEEIDTDFSGEITKDELTSYMIKKNYETSFVNVIIFYFTIII